MDVGHSRLVVAESVEVPKGVPEEVGSVETPVDGLLLVLVAHERQSAGDVGVDREPGRYAGVGPDDLVVLAHPLLGLTGLHEPERQGTEALGGGQADGLALGASHPQRGVGPLERLGHHVARWHLQPRAVPAGEGLLDHHPGSCLDVVQPLVALGGPIDPEAVQFGVGGRLPGSEVDPTV